MALTPRKHGRQVANLTANQEGYAGDPIHGAGRLLGGDPAGWPAGRRLARTRGRHIAGGAAAGLAARCEVVGGDFFAAVPTGGDCCVLANVIHDWNNDRAVAILRNCHRAMADGGRVLIIEAVLPTGNEPHPGKIGDLQMLIISGGRERTEAEYRDLLVTSGFEPTRVIPTASPVSAVEGIRP